MEARALGIRDGQTSAVTFVQRFIGDEFETQELLAQTVAALQEALAAAVKPPLSPGQGFEDPGKPQCARVAGQFLTSRRTEHRGRGGRGDGRRRPRPLHKHPGAERRCVGRSC